MLLEHTGKRPAISDSAYVAPTATISGDVRIGANSRVLFGAVLTADGGPIEIGESCIVMENAVVRGTGRHPTRIGSSCLVGPRASLSGCTVEDSVFLATGVTVFNGARIGKGAEVRVNAVVHVNSRVASGAAVPIGWVAVGDPAEVLPPNEHERIWAIQKGLDFPGTVFGLARAPADELMLRLTERYARGLAAHLHDRILDSD
ncbi:MAG: gamma carbonic anhydrase family protein [Actinobacteria bacterium]|nr:gamma carbonic anhydrase family protein [Actinomycetota bacterium]